MKAINKKHFSLLEILSVMTIIVILFTITVGLFGLFIDRMKNTKTETLVKQISFAMQAYRADHGFYFVNTTSSSDTPRFKFNLGDSVDTEFVKDFDYEPLRSGGFIKTESGQYAYFVDAWGNPLIYECPGNINKTMFDLGSLGKDGMYGSKSSDPADFGKGDDITNFNF